MAFRKDNKRRIWIFGITLLLLAACESTPLGFTLLFSSGSGGTVFTSTNMEQITVLDEVGNTIFTWSAP